MESLRVLVLENEHLPAAEVNAVLSSAGLGPARFVSSPEEVERLVAEDRPDAVFLSLVPGFASSEPLLAADLTFRCRLPVFYLETRFGDSNLPAGYLVRPFDASRLAEMFRANGLTQADPSTKDFSILDKIASPVAHLSKDGEFLWGNEAAKSLFGTQDPPADHASLWEYRGARALSAAVQAAITQSPPEGRPPLEVFEPEGRRWWRTQLDQAGDDWFLHLQDVTAQMRARQEDSRLEKLENLGILARGFAHDFNNVLTVLLGHLHMARMHQPLPDGCESDLDGARAAAARAQSMVQQLLTFARGGTPIRESLDLNQLLREWLERRPPSPATTVVPDFAPVPLRVSVDKNQIQRLAENLLRNAEQAAFPAGGPTCVRTRLLDRNSLPAPSVPRLDPSLTYAYLEVRDQGKGISDADLPHVFEPYFSTRSTENASGLGLTVCDSIARAHHGAMALDSKVGSHTSAYLILPLETTPEGPAPPQPEEPSKSSRVLVLEDDEHVRRFMVQILRLRPCEVVETADGAEAVEAFRAAHAADRPFDVLVFDLTIPKGLGGKDAIDQIRRIDPSVRAIVSSGYYDDPVMSNYREYGFCAVLPKPYEPAELLKLVDRILEEKPAPSPPSSSSRDS